jgi:hypothetical protein
MRKHLQLRRLDERLFLAGGQGFLNRFDYLIDLVQAGADVLEQELFGNTLAMNRAQSFGRSRYRVSRSALPVLTCRPQ